MFTEIVEIKKRTKVPFDEAKLTEAILDKCIKVYLKTGNISAIGRLVGRPRSWAQDLVRCSKFLERLKSQVLEIEDNKNIATIEECLEKLTSIARGDQLLQLADRVKEVVGSNDSVLIADAIDKISRYTPQIESNQIKATTMLLTAQGAMDPNRAAKDDHQAVLDEIILELVKSQGSVDAIIAGVNKHKKIEVIDV